MEAAAAPKATPTKVSPISLPSIVITVLSAVAGVFTALLQAHVFTIGSPWANDLSIAVLCIGVFVGPATGIEFRNLFHFTAPVLTGIDSVLAVLGILAMKVTDLDLRGILFGIVTVAGILGFGLASPQHIAAQWHARQARKAAAAGP